MLMKKKIAPKTVKGTDLNAPEIVVFHAPKPVAGPGTVQLHSFGSVMDKVFGRTVQDVKADFDKVSAQLDAILAGAFAKVTSGMKMDEVEISLGFTAEGKLAFIAQAGVEASVKVTFRRA